MLSPVVGDDRRKEDSMSSSEAPASRRTHEKAAKPRRNTRKALGMMACNRCRRRRIRCSVDDTESEACQACERAGLACDFAEADKRKETFKDTRGRLAEVEAILQRIRTCSDEELAAVVSSIRAPGFEDRNSRVTAEGSTLATVGLYEEDTEIYCFTAAATVPAALPVEPVAVSYDNAADAESSDEGNGHATQASLDLATLVDRLILDDAGVIRSDGNLSNSALAAAIEESPWDDLPANISEPGSVSPPLDLPEVSVTRASLFAAIAVNIDALPLGVDIRLVEHLLHLFFLHFHPLFSVLSRTIFFRHFVTGDRYFSPFLLNAILALASQFVDSGSPLWPGKPAQAMGLDFLTRARSYLPTEVASPSITTVQGLCLLAKREALCGKANEAGLLFVHCSRLALDLGLHLNGVRLLRAGLLQQIDVYVRSRTFWGIWNIDKELNALAGRPAAIKDIVITCPKAGYWQAEDYDWGSYSYGYQNELGLPNGSRGIFYLVDVMQTMSDTWVEYLPLVYLSAPRLSLQRALSRLEVVTARLRTNCSRLPDLSVSDLNPPEIGLHMQHQALIITFNRPFLFSTARSSLAATVETPRQRCLTAAATILRLFGILKSKTTYASTLMFHQNDVITAIAVLLCDLMGSRSTSTLQGRLMNSIIDDVETFQASIQVIEGLFVVLEELSSFRSGLLPTRERLERFYANHIKPVANLLSFNPHTIEAQNFNSDTFAAINAPFYESESVLRTHAENEPQSSLEYAINAEPSDRVRSAMDNASSIFVSNLGEAFYKDLGVVPTEILPREPPTPDDFFSAFLNM